ncbi:MAG: EamA family transporter [Syntrophomonas sp.]
MKRFWGGLYLSLAFGLAGSSVVAARVVAASLGVFTVAASSLLLAWIGLWASCSKRLFRDIRCLNRSDWTGLLVQAACGIFFFRLFLLKGLSWTSAGEAGVLTGATPAFTVILAAWLLKEAPGTKRILGIISTVLGIFFIQGGLEYGGAITRAHWGGNAMVLAAALSESLFNISSKMDSVRKKYAQNSDLDPMVKTTLVIGIALLLYTVPACLERPWAGLMALDLRQWLALLWYGLVATALGYVFWYAGIKRCPASSAAAFSGLMPLTALFLSFLLLGETPGLDQWLGGGLVVTGMLLAGASPAGADEEK